MQSFQRQLTIVIALFLMAGGTHAQQPEVFVQLGHSDFVRSVAFSPDGKLALSGSYDNIIVPKIVFFGAPTHG